MKQDSMMLFGSSEPLAIEAAKCISVKPRYVYQRVKQGKKWVVVRDEANNPVPELNKVTGLPLVQSTRIALLPRSSKDNPDLKDATGKTGQALFAFERTLRDGLCDASLAEKIKLRATGQYTFGSETRNERSGIITIKLIPTYGGKSVVASPDEDLQKEMERRGYKVTKSPGKDNGESDAAPKPEAPATTKKGKKS